MKVFVCGATGFIGSALCAAFTAAGHTVVRGVREPAGAGEVAIDYSRDLSPETWIPRLTGIEVVVNAVGIIVEGPGRRFDDIHHRAPAALFAACVAAGVKRVVQISALGAGTGESRYFRSKAAADACLMAQPIEWQILRPALVYGEDGASAGLFRTLASLPLLVLPGRGDQALQPVHVDDLAAAAVRLAAPATPAGQCVDLVGPAPVSYRRMLETYRQGLGLAPTGALSVPAPAMALAARCLEWLPGALLNRETWAMLQAGNTGDATRTQAVLGRPPRPLAHFIPPDRRLELRQRALAAWRMPLLRGTLAFVWLATALTSALVFPEEESLALLARVGLAGLPALAALYGAALLDLLMGIACIAFPGRRLWAFQMGLVLVYTGIIAWALPDFLGHPFGPVTKNVPILALLLILSAEETRP